QGGATLVKHQWDCLFSSGVVIGMFEKEEDGAYIAQIAQCLGGAAIDFALYYSVTWVSMFFDDAITTAPNFTDFSIVTNYKDFSWKEAGVSASISCAAAVIPAFSSGENVKKLAVGMAAFAGAAEGMTTELAKQYDITSARLTKEGKANGISDVLLEISWTPVLANAGISGAITGFSAYVVTKPQYAVLVAKLKRRLNVTGNKFTSELTAYVNKRLGKSVSGAGSDLLSFVNKTLTQKLDDIKGIWSTKYPIQEMLEGRSFFEDIMGQYRYLKSSGWSHTGDISEFFKGVDFYKGTTQGANIFAETAVSMKTTITTNVDNWLTSAPMKKNHYCPTKL
ncbi:hypothetical protein, partial [Williamwhitmania taraxaci]